MEMVFDLDGEREAAIDLVRELRDRVANAWVA
jgi:hypothetical protein